jgi:hypothetical protein
MAFLSLTQLTAKTIVRLRAVPGPSVQLYAEDAIAQILEETYEMVRSIRWWDHLMSWSNQQLDGSTGRITGTIIGARERFRDVQHVFYGTNNTPIPIASSDINTFRLTGTLPRFIEPLNVVDDAAGTKLVRVWPLASITTSDKPIRLRVRTDPANVFTDPSVIIPFDATCLINGAAHKYAADDGTNPASVMSLQNAFEARLEQLRRQHDSAVVLLDPRMSNPNTTDLWVEDWR